MKGFNSLFSANDDFSHTKTLFYVFKHFGIFLVGELSLFYLNTSTKVRAAIEDSRFQASYHRS